MKGLVLSVSQLNEYVRKTLSADPMVQHICLKGEISNFKRQVSGHWYFSLKDEDASVNCVMFRQAAQMVRFNPENGVSVRLFGSVGLYAKTGAYQFYGDMMEREGMGELYLRFEALKQKLMAEGLFDAALKKPLPLLPKGVGIVTSGTGAVVHDIQTVAWRRNPGIPLYLCPVKVQGEGAAREIAAALKRLDGLDAVDVLIVGRGGGSMEDLWPFNEECVARAIAACHKPVVSAVGHETDFTIADFAADLRAPTPSAAAELCVQAREALLNEAHEPLERMTRRLHAAFAAAELRLSRLNALMARGEPEQRLQKQTVELQGLARRLSAAVEPGFRQGERRLESLRLRLDAAAAQGMQRRERRLAEATIRLRAVSPMATVARGYAVVLKRGKPVKTVKNTAVSDALELLLSDGRLGVTVTKIETGE